MLDFLRKFTSRRRVIHLDYAATTPVAPEVLRAMLPYFRDEWANPSAIYRSGVRARTVINQMREKLARMLRIRANGVIFTSGGTESNNLAIIGIIERLHNEGRAYEDIEILTTKIEHASVLESISELEHRGVHVVYVPLHDDGHIDIRAFESLLSPRTALITFAYVNSEIGVIQDVKHITRMVRAHNKKCGSSTLVHLDAAQAPLWLPCEMDMLGVDLLSLDSGKCYGPKGAGVLAFRHGVKLSPVVFGGGQEGGLRSGTENAPLIVGCTLALVRAQATWEARAERVRALRDRMFDELLKAIPDGVVNGGRIDRVANNVNISIPGIDAEYAVITLDHHGIAASTKSACGAGDTAGSAVVRELTHDDARAQSTVRFTLGEETTNSDIETVVRVLNEHVSTTRAFTKTLRTP